MRLNQRVPILLLALSLIGLVPSASGQSIFSTLTGVVADPGGAVVPGAKVVLKDARSGSTRDTVTNNDGYYTFASIPASIYNLTVETKGFETSKVNGIDVSGGEKRNVNFSLKISTTADAVEVISAADLVTPVDSGGKTNIISTKQLDNFIVVGSNATEFIKIMPGFGISNGTSNKSGFSGEVIGINGNGDGGSQSPLNNNFSYNGLPSNSLDITADGAHVSDPGCNCATPVNPNTDFIGEFQVKASNFSAEDQKGPIVASSISKAGGKDFHGSMFLYARDYVLNANDALFNANGQTKPQNKYFYPGFTLGGPVIIPGTNFNKNRDKLFFFTGYEYFYQVLDTGLLRATVPTPGMLTGNFSPAELSKLGNITASGGPPGKVDTTKYPGGIIPATQLDPNMVNLAKLYPGANANPNATGGYNYVQAAVFNQNSYQWSTRVDYSISDNTKLFVKYNMQREVQQFPVGLWWRQTDQVPYPTPVEGKNKSDQVTASLTHVFSPTMTNEFVFAYSYIGFPNVFQDPSKVDRTKVGYSQKGLFNNDPAQIPSFGGTGWANQEAALIFNPGGFEAGGASQGLYADKWLPSISDSLTKVWSTHTVKAGVFWERIRNAQPANNSTNAQLQVYTGNSNTVGDEYADLLLGNLNGYSQTNFNRLNDIDYTTFEGFVQDSWKVNKKLTLELGLRLTHFTPWADRLGFGYSVFNYSQYKSTCLPTDYCGFSWHKKDPNVPIGGFPTRAVFYQPRFGLAYSPFHDGKTVFRGGWGRYYYHSGQFTSGLDAAAGVLSISLPNNINGQPLLLRNLSSINVAAQASSPAAVDSKDDKQAYTQSYSFTISRQLPWSSLLEVAYVGNSTSDIAGTYMNINPVPVGALLASKNGGVDPNSLTANNFRPLLGFSDLRLATNNAYSNYNALQTTWVRTKGKYVINANYTYGKALGILGNNGALYDEFNINNNYGVLPSNRKQIFNVAYSVELGSPLKGNKIAQGVVNGWQLSGLVQVQSGPNLTGNSTQNFSFSLNSYKIPGTDVNVSNASLLGTTNIQLNPIVTCDPTGGLKPQQFINPSCFAIPKSIGQNGPTILPAIYGPAFFNADLGLFKNFQIKEQMKVQLRFNAYNFLNHPLWSFNGSNLSLGFDGTSGAVNTPQFGTTTQKQGHRVIQLAAKFYF